jgi:hypothetical protein
MINIKGRDRYPRLPKSLGLPSTPPSNINYWWPLLGRPSGSGMLAMRNVPLIPQTATHTNVIYVGSIFVQEFEMGFRDSSAEALQ